MRLTTLPFNTLFDLMDVVSGHVVRTIGKRGLREKNPAILPLLVGKVGCGEKKRDRMDLWDTPFVPSILTVFFPFYVAFLSGLMAAW